MPRSLTSAQRAAGKRKLAAKRGVSVSSIDDDAVLAALDTGSLSLSDCSPSSGGFSGGDTSGGGFSSSSDSGSSGGGGGGGCD